MFRRTLTLMLMACTTVACSSFSHASITWLDFTGWNHAQITTTGQTFTSILPGIDVTVTGTPNPFFATLFDGDGKIRTAVSNSSQQLSFLFSAPLSVVVDVQSLDKYESLTVTTGGPISYSHSLGAIPTIAGSITMSGNGVAFGPLGAARGVLDLGTTSAFDWMFSSGRRNKYEAFRVGTNVVPEPSSFGLIGMAVLGLARVVRSLRRPETSLSSSWL